ncbi:CPBP family intramembrane glutamic endopeptidase [uncultured Lacinutrix sp.]|uniref:CPBP family intramembrane glutamic endopeptidase n=1 Tax=uncultured Lacinutrix sp. TaxID=574032 RepID=UPI0026349EBE|nr:CPBP family intramembrane glutamic endopeptidase [uncultured Lacinutrix sp.]
MNKTFIDIITFLKAPNCESRESLPIKQKLIVVLYTLCFSFIVAISLGMLISVFDHLEIIDMNKHANSELFENFSPIKVLFLVAIVAPVLEELIFRAPITLFCKYNRQFKYIFYAFAIAFGYVHLFNFEIHALIILLSPILVLPQIILGMFLGYIRIKLGLPYSILLHGLYNGILSAPILLFGDMLGV